MARKRQVDPEYPFEQEIAQLSLAARYFYILSWCHMDDTNGVLPHNTFKLKGQIFPSDNIDVELLIQELVSSFRLIPFEAENKKWLWCPKLLHHQVINHPSKKKYPNPPEKLQQDYRNGTLLLPQSRKSRVERVEKIDSKDSGEPQQAVSKDNLWNTVYKKGFNIYAFMHKFTNLRGIEIPMPVLDKVCTYFINNTSKIKNQWGWFLVSVKRAAEEYHVQLNINRSQEAKNAPINKQIKSLIENLCKEK